MLPSDILEPTNQRAKTTEPIPVYQSHRSAASHFRLKDFASWLLHAERFLRPHIPALFGHPEEAIDDSVERDLRHMADLSEQVLAEAGEDNLLLIERDLD